MEAEEARTIQLCLCPLLIYALLAADPLAAGPRAEWRLLQACENGLQGEDAFSATLVDGLKSNLHKFHAHYRTLYAAADTATLEAALSIAAATLDELAASGIDPAGYRRALRRFADFLGEGSDRGASRASHERVTRLLADPA